MLLFAQNSLMVFHGIWILNLSEAHPWSKPLLSWRKTDTVTVMCVTTQGQFREKRVVMAMGSGSTSQVIQWQHGNTFFFFFETFKNIRIFQPELPKDRSW